MSVSCEHSCVGCPALQYIDGQSEKSESAREIIIEEAVRVMGLAEKLKNVPDPAPFKAYEARVATRKEECVTVLADLDRGEAILQQTRAEIVEACPNGEPYVTYETGPLGRRILRCASDLANELPDRMASAVLPDPEQT